jgi:GT2 family glycosyltransferase
MNKKQLVSFILLSYKNYHYIYGAIDSVLHQDYPNIEIIISNDGSNDFNKKEVEKYLKRNCKKNIKNFIVNNNKINLGTVKNINKAIKLSKGEYIMILAADDILYDKEVISKTIRGFNSLPKSELIVVSQIGMYDIKLKKLIQPFVSEDNKEKIKKLPPEKLFSEMSTKCILPGCGICYKRKIFEKYGYFDEKYILIEDYSSALKFSRLGIKYNFLDFISCKHRDGGLSHGNINGESQKSKQYELDILNIFKNEVSPYLYLLNNKQKKEFLNRLKNQTWTYSYRFMYKNGSKRERRKFIKNNFTTISYSFFNNIKNDIKDQLKGKKFKIFILGITLLSVYSLHIDFGSSIYSILNIPIPPEIPDIINKIVGFSGLFFTIISILFTIFLFIKKYLLQIYNFLIFIF